jgi:hypothetical protein
MQNPNERPATAAGRAPVNEPQRQPPRNVGVRGCWELLLKLIIALILILIFILWYFGRGREFVGQSPYLWVVLLILILLLLWLIWLQKHFVSLTCNLTAPTGCVIGHTDLLAGFSLEPIRGTASGIGFVRYELELIYNPPGGPQTTVTDGIIYADGGGNPDASLTFGNHQVTSGTLGFVDLRKAGETAGAGIANSTDFRVRMRVVGLGGTDRTCQIDFKVIAAAAYIKYVGGGYAPDYGPTAEQLHVSDSAASAPATVGGSVSVRGAADVWGCDEKIAEYHVWAIPGFGVAQPDRGDPVVPAADWTEVVSVVYQNADPAVFSARVYWNELVPDLSFLTNFSWSTRTEHIPFDSTIIDLPGIPDLVPVYWDSLNNLTDPSGKYTFLLQVIDETGHTFYDIQQVWIDNKDFQGKISSLRYHGSGTDISPCTDVLINNGTGTARQLDIRGYATDPLIIAGDVTVPTPGDLTQPTSDNFGSYNVTFIKQGAAAESAVTISANPVPDRATWRGAVGEPAVPPADILATLDLSWLDAGGPPAVDFNGNPIPNDQRLPRQSSCTYIIFLRGGDSTIVSEGTNHQVPGGFYPFPVKIVNDLP